MTLSEIASRMDTRSLLRDDHPTKALVVANFSERAFQGIAVLSADFSTRSPRRSVRVFLPEGIEVPSRVVRESFGPPDSEGRRRWRFDLEFVCSLSATTAQAFGAVFAGGDPLPWPENSDAATTLAAVETECREGELPNPYWLSQSDPT